MFIAYGVMGLIKPFNEYFWIFYVSLCTITIWVAFKFMSAEKILKYGVIEQLSKFKPMQQGVYDAMWTEQQIDGVIQPDQTMGEDSEAIAKEKDSDLKGK